jgi:hypothetical protein
MIQEGNANAATPPTVFHDENQLLEHVDDIDLLVIASPNYMHTPQLLRWGQHDNISILVEKPVAINLEQVAMLKNAAKHNKLRANIWVAMEYRFIPAINKLIQLLPEVGQIKKVAIRENRYPFLSKIGEWNKDIHKSGDTLVEKCCHFFDLFRLITGQEMDSCVSKGKHATSFLFYTLTMRKVFMELIGISQLFQQCIAVCFGIITDTTITMTMMSPQSLIVHMSSSTLHREMMMSMQNRILPRWVATCRGIIKCNIRQLDASNSACMPKVRVIKKKSS